MEPVKNKKKCMQYVIKDGVYIQDGTLNDAPFQIDSWLQSTVTKSGYGFTYMANALKEGKTLDQLDDDIGGHVMNHKRKIEEYAVFLQEKKIRNTPKPKFPGFKNVRDPQWQKVVNWCNKNFLLPREKRQDQLWLWSAKPKLGKSWPFAVQLRDFFNLYEWAPEEKQESSIKDAQYLLFDDFHGTCTVSMLKRLAQMYGTIVPIKLGTRVDFRQNIPMIITSNDDPRGVFTNVETNHIGALEDRFEIIEVTTRCWLQLKEEVQILVPATPTLSPPISEQDARLLLDTPLPPYPQPLQNIQPQDMDTGNDLQVDLGDKEDISEMSDSDDDRNDDDHSVHSHEEFTKKKWIKKYRKDIN